jgi:hypothetical protein
MNTLDRTIWNLKLLAACPYCGDNPCDHDCIMWKDSDDLTKQELQDRESLEIARIALESARKINRPKSIWVFLALLFMVAWFIHLMIGK